MKYTSKLFSMVQITCTFVCVSNYRFSTSRAKVYFVHRYFSIERTIEDIHVRNSRVKFNLGNSKIPTFYSPILVHRSCFVYSSRNLQTQRRLDHHNATVFIFGKQKKKITQSQVEYGHQAMFFRFHSSFSPPLVPIQRYLPIYQQRLSLIISSLCNLIVDRIYLLNRRSRCLRFKTNWSVARSSLYTPVIVIHIRICHSSRRYAVLLFWPINRSRRRDYFR